MAKNTPSKGRTNFCSTFMNKNYMFDYPSLLGFPTKGYKCDGKREKDQEK